MLFITFCIVCCRPTVGIGSADEMIMLRQKEADDDDNEDGITCYSNSSLSIPSDVKLCKEFLITR